MALNASALGTESALSTSKSKPVSAPDELCSVEGAFPGRIKPNRPNRSAPSDPATSPIFLSRSDNAALISASLAASLFLAEICLRNSSACRRTQSGEGDFLPRQKFPVAPGPWLFASGSSRESRPWADSAPAARQTEPACLHRSRGECDRPSVDDRAKRPRCTTARSIGEAV